MEEKKQLRLNIITVFLIIAILVIMLMGYAIYKLSDAKLQSEEKVSTLENQTNELQATLDSIRSQLNNIINTSSNKISTGVESNNSSSTESTSVKTEKEEAEEVAKEFIKAVNSKDWDIVEKYSDKYTVSTIQTYKISNMSINFDTYEYINNHHTYRCSYDIESDEIESPKDVGLGKLFCINKENGKFTVTPYATAP